MKNQNKLTSSILLILIMCSWAPNNDLHAFENDEPTVLITGSNRNLGLEFVKQFSKKHWNVIATARNPKEADELQEFAANNNLVLIFTSSGFFFNASTYFIIIVIASVA